jgi:hypothetical protein
MFQPLHGHPQGGLKQRNTIVGGPVKHVHMWSPKYNVAIKIAKNI